MIHTAPIMPRDCTNFREAGPIPREGTEIWSDAEFLAIAADPARAAQVCPGCLRAVKERTEHAQSSGYMAGFTVGARVRFVTDEERYPHFIIPKGREGTVTEVPGPGCGGAVIKIDGPDIEGLHDGEWEGDFAWLPEDEDWFNGPDYPERPWPGRPFVIVDSISGAVVVDRLGREVKP